MQSGDGVPMAMIHITQLYNETQLGLSAESQSFATFRGCPYLTACPMHANAVKELSSDAVRYVVVRCSPMQ